MDKQTILEAFDDPHPSRDYLIEHHVHEFSSLCPRTGQPDYAAILIRYEPARRCIELKSLKLYLQAYRDQGIYYEDVTNMILADLAGCCGPKWMEVRTTWRPRGGIHSVVTASHGQPPATVAAMPS